nr:MAG TPA: hypothetical protein [Caudoviricetes sp.]
MRNLQRNQRPLWYAPYLGKTEIVVNGTKTGQYASDYGEPELIYASLATNKGAADAEQFGAALQYDTVMTSVTPYTLNEYSKIWIDCSPADSDANYICIRAAKGLDQHVWALQRVEK